MSNKRSALGRAIVVGLIAVMAVIFRMNTAAAAEIKINDKTFPDPEFREWVLIYCDTNRNGSLSAGEIRAVTKIQATGSEIASLKGIELFTELQKLMISGNLQGTLDLRSNPKLVDVDIYSSYKLTSIDVSGCPDLEWLNVSSSGIRSLDISHNPKLIYLSCERDYLQSLDVTHNPKLVHLRCTGNRITSLNLTGLTKLETLTCNQNPLTTLDLSRNKLLREVDCSACAISSIKFGTGYTQFLKLDCSKNQLKSLDVTNVPLQKLYCFGNQLNEKTLKLGSHLREFCDTTYHYENTWWEEYGNITNIVTIYETEGAPNDQVVIDSIVPFGDDVTVLFHSGGYYIDSGPVLRQNQKAGTSFTIPKVSLSRSDEWYFLGWAMSPGADKAQFKTGDSITLYRNTILYAVWKDSDIHVRFDLNGGTSGAPANMSGIPYQCYYFEIPYSAPVREGYYFLGWSSNRTATEPEYKSGDVAYTVSGEITFYAVWKPRTNKISFNLNGGSGTTPATISVLSGKNATIPKANVSRSNYWFLGWSTNKNAMAATYKSGDKLSVTKDTVLYAVWKLNGYMLTFDANGGTNPPAKITAAKGATVTIPKSSVTRDGYWFLGWATSKTAATAQYKSGNTLKLTANTTLYAVWKKK